MFSIIDGIHEVSVGKITQYKVGYTFNSERIAPPSGIGDIWPYQPPKILNSLTENIIVITWKDFDSL